MKVIKFLGVAAVAVLIVSCNKSFQTNKSLKTEIDSVSYAIGVDMSNKIMVNFSEIDSDLFFKGYLDAKDSANLLIDKKEINNVVRSYFKKAQQEKMKEQQAKAKVEAEKKFGHVRKEGEKFLAENKSKKGIITTASGLQFKVLKEGKGESPKLNQKVKIHYHGTLIDGSVFDSSVEKKNPITHNVSGFVKGFTEALQLMKVGGKYKLFIPQELGYGATPSTRKITFSPIIFDVELLEIKK